MKYRSFAAYFVQVARECKQLFYFLLMRRAFLFLLVLFFVLVAAIATQSDIRMTGPKVSASATADPGRADVVEVLHPSGNLISTQDASYDLLVKAETEADGNGWVGVRAAGSLDTGFQLNPALSIEKVGFLLLFSGMKTTTVYARGNFLTSNSGSRTLTGSGIAALSAGGDSLLFSGGSFGVGTGSEGLTVSGATITDTTSFKISLVTQTSGN